MKKPIIGITQGDPNGVGMEIILKAFTTPLLFDYCVPVLYANPKTFAFHKKALNLEQPMYQMIKDISEAKPNQLNLIASNQEAVEIQLGKPSPLAGAEALKAIDRLLMDANHKHLDAMVTAPIDKSSIETVANFTGHTGYIQKATGANDVLMVLFNDDIRVGLITEHLPISQIAAAITKEKIISKLRIAHQTLKRDFGINKPKIAVLGLNPHSGDNGKLGKEELDIIQPAIEAAKQEQIFCLGPYSADGFFGMKQYQQFDLVMAMYHDQGLIPFKSMAFDDGVNYTAGLTVPRTSPDHGTAYDITGKGIASPLSFVNAMFEAINIYHQRNNEDELRANPLPYAEFKRERFRLEQA